MIDYFVHIIDSTLLPWGAFGVFLAGALEEIIAPIPSPAVMLGAGFFFLEGAVTPEFVGTLIFTVAIPASLGITLGSLLVYGLAYAFGKPMLIRWGALLGLKWEDVERLKGRMDETSRDESLILFARIIPIIPGSAIAAFCGVIRMRVFKYIVITLAGTFLRAVILALIGWQVGRFYYQYAEMISRYEKIFLLATLLSVLIYLIYRSRRKTHRSLSK